MAMVQGDAIVGTAGLALDIYNNWVNDGVNNGMSSPLSTAQKTSVGSLCNAIAKAVIAQIQTNATVTIKTTDAGLQTSASAGSATTAPATNKTLPGGAIQ